MNLRLTFLLLGTLFLVSCSGAPAGPVRVYIRASDKTHGEGEHDYPRFLADWSKLLQQRGCVVAGARKFPSTSQLDKTDVLVIYAADGQSMAAGERAALERFVTRGGGLVVLHDGMCGTNAAWFAQLAGGAKTHGVTNWQRGVVRLDFAEPRHPITQGVVPFAVDDEMFYHLDVPAEARVLATTVLGKKEVVPQMWVLERGKSRAFGWAQGHRTDTLEMATVRGLILRAMAWTAGRDVDLLTQDEERNSFPYPGGGPSAPENSPKKLRTMKGFEVTAVAAEPAITKPVALDWDARGRLWVAQAPGDAGGRLVVVGSNVSGPRRVETKVFAEANPPIASFVFHRDGVIAAQGPRIIWWRDSDGDGTAESKEVLFEGFGDREAREPVQQLTWGLDGWIYGTQSASGPDGTNIVGRSGQAFGTIGPGVMRFRPDGTAIETVVLTSSNIAGVALSWEGEVYFAKTGGPHISHAVLPERFFAGGKLGTNDAARAIEDHGKLASGVGFTAASGGMIYDGGAWPIRYHGAYYVCEPSARVVHEDVIVATESGMTYEGIRRDEREFITGNDPWFFPVQARVGPDGAMYLADLYRPSLGPDVAGYGRVWRVQHEDARRFDPPGLDQAGTEALVKSLLHPNAWVRQTAQRLLVERADTAAAGPLRLLLTNRLQYAQVHALWTLHHLGALAATNLAIGLTNWHPAVQRAALRIAETLGPQMSTNIERLVQKQFKDVDDRTRLTALCALSGARLSSNGLQNVLKLFADAKDGWTRSTTLALARKRPMEYIEGAFASDKSEQVRELIEPLVETYCLNRQSNEVASLIQLAGRHPTGTERLNATVISRIEQNLGPDFAPTWSDEFEAAVKKLFGSKSRTVQVATMSLASHWPDHDYFNAESKKVRDGIIGDLRNLKVKEEDRMALLTGIVRVKASHPYLVPVMARMFTTNYSPKFQDHLVWEFGRIRLPAAYAALISHLHRLPGETREGAVALLSRRADSAGQLLDALEAGEVEPMDLGLAGISRLRNYSDPKIAARATRFFDAALGRPETDRAVLALRLESRFDRPMDRDNGRALLRGNCLTCHKLDKEGHEIGPDLIPLGAHTAEFLLTHLLDPGRHIDPHYQAYTVETRRGDEFVGVIGREGRESIVLRTLAADLILPRADIVRMDKGKASFMPEGFELFGDKDVRDMLGYLMDKGPKGFRLLDLEGAFTADSRKGIYAEQTEKPDLALKRFGTVVVEGVPFRIANAATAARGKNLIVLKGGEGFAQTLPQRVDVKVGAKAGKIHVLGGIAGGGYPVGGEAMKLMPAVKVTVHYANDTEEEIVLRNGEQFADYVKQIDVPGSKFVPDFASHSQLRFFTMAPKGKTEIKSLTLESFGNQLAPTFVALTTQE